MQEIQVRRGYRSGRQERIAHPTHQPRPVGSTDEHHREMPDLADLDERERLEQLVQRPEAAGQDDESVRVFHEHRLAREEVTELHTEVHVRVQPLLMSQLDVAPDGHAATLAAASIGGLHRAGTAAGDDGITGLREFPADGPRLLVDRVVPGRPGGPEDRHCRPEMGQGVEPLHELREDAQRPPGIGLEEVRTGPALEELLVLRRSRVALHHLGGPGRHPQASRSARAGCHVIHAGRMPPGRWSCAFAGSEPLV